MWKILPLLLTVCAVFAGDNSYTLTANEHTLKFQTMKTKRATYEKQESNVFHCSVLPVVKVPDQPFSSVCCEVYVRLMPTEKKSFNDIVEEGKKWLIRGLNCLKQEIKLSPNERLLYFNTFSDQGKRKFDKQRVVFMRYFDGVYLVIDILKDKATKKTAANIKTANQILTKILRTLEFDDKKIKISRKIYEFPENAYVRTTNNHILEFQTIKNKRATYQTRRDDFFWCSVESDIKPVLGRHYSNICRTIQIQFRITEGKSLEDVLKAEKNMLVDNTHSPLRKEIKKSPTERLLCFDDIQTTVKRPYVSDKRVVYIKYLGDAYLYIDVVRNIAMKLPPANRQVADKIILKILSTMKLDEKDIKIDKIIWNKLR